jgi:hypothetical protein
MKIKSILLTLLFSLIIPTAVESKPKNSPKACNGDCANARETDPRRIAEKKLLGNRERTDLLNYLIIQRGYKSYLEIGIADGANFQAIKAEKKIGVDPSPASLATYRLTSDDFFSQNQETFDIIFIDGLHWCEQVLRDVENSLSCLNPGGVIVMHDCMPNTYEQQGRTPVPGAWNGDVWKAAAYIRMNLQNVHFCVLDMDWGCGILTPNSKQELFPLVSMDQLDWNFYTQNKKALLNIHTLENWLNHPRNLVD